MREIHCDECGQFLFETDKSNGAAGSQAQHLGFVFKMPVLFTEKYSTLFFCDHDCAKNFYRININGNPEADKKLKEFKGNIPKYASDCAEGLSKIKKSILKTRSK